MIKEYKTTKRESWSMNVKFVPILYTGVLHADALQYDEEGQLEVFKAKLMSKNNGQMPRLEDMSSLTNGLCEVTQQDHVDTCQVWFEWEVAEWRAE